MTTVIENDDLEKEYQEELAKAQEQQNRILTRDDKIALLADAYEYTPSEVASSNVDFIAELQRKLLYGKLDYLPYLELLRENAEVHLIALQIAVQSKAAKQHYQEQ
jgi:hypothetical protein